MNCANCGGVSDVLDSRHIKGGAIRRRRQCRSCKRRWTTLEIDFNLVPLLEQLMQILGQTPAQPSGRKPSNFHTPRRHGIVVPPELEDDWQVLKRSGYTDFDAARTLNLPIPVQMEV